MERIVIACYTPKPGKEKELDELMKTHLPILKQEGLVTDRKSIIMKSASGTVVEVFEWKSKEAIEAAHHNKAVQEMWERYHEVCSYEIAADIKEFGQLFSEFTPMN